MTEIHPTALVDPKAELGSNVKIGPYSIVEGGVTIGDETEIRSHAVIAEGTTIGKKCFVSPGAVIGTKPQDLKFEDEKTFVEIGDYTTIREFATVNRATSYSYYTRVGSHCLLMAYSHIAHDCHLGDHVIIANAVNMAGHVTIDNHVGIGGMTAIHQFVHIGAHSFIGGGLRVTKDVPPYILAMGDPLTYGGLNLVGLKRRGFSSETLGLLKKAYKTLYRSNLTFQEAIQHLSSEYPQTDEIKYLIDFLKRSERGVIR